MRADEGEEDLLEGGLLLDVLDLRGRKQALESGEGVVRDDAALMEDRDAVGQLLRLIEILRGEQHGGAGVRELLDHAPHLDARFGVEPGGRLVEVDDLGVSDQTHRDVETATHAARVGADLAPAGIRQTERGEQVVGDLPGVGQMPQLRDEHEVLASGEDLVDRGELSGEADALAHSDRVCGHIHALHRRGSGIRLQQGGEDAHHGGLTGAVRAEEGEDAALLDLEVDAAQHVQIFVGLLDAVHRDGGVRHDSSFFFASSNALMRRARSLSIHCRPPYAAA